MEKIYNFVDIKIINKIRKDKGIYNFSYLKEMCETYFFKNDSDDYIQDYNRQLSLAYMTVHPELLNEEEVETYFLMYQCYLMLKSNRILEDYSEHLYLAGRTMKTDLEEFYDDLHLKYLFLSTRVRKHLKNKQVDSTAEKEIDLNNTKGTEKIIMLKQLGILDFLKEKQPFNLSTNALASALSGITGIETSTLQSYINPIDNPNVNQKNNPLIRAC